MRDDRAVPPDHCVHTAQRVLPILLGEGTGERSADHLLDTLQSRAVEIGGVDQAGSLYLGVHSPCLPAPAGSSHYESGPADRGRAQCSRTRWPARTWATLTMSTTITTPMTG